MTVSRPALVVTVDGEPESVHLTRVRAADLRLAQRQRGYLRAEAERAGREPGEFDVYPDVVDGARGIGFIHSCLESSNRGGAWIDVKF